MRELCATETTISNKGSECYSWHSILARDIRVFAASVNLMIAAAKLATLVLLIVLRVTATQRIAGNVLKGDQRLQWFGFNRVFGQLSLGFWVAWLAISWWMDAWTDLFIPMVDGFRESPAIVISLALAWNFLVLVLPAVVSIWCEVIAYPAVQALRNLGLTRREYLIDAAFLRIWIPVAAAIFWTGIVVTEWTVVGVFLPIFGALWLILMPKVWIRARGSEVYVPFSVTHGPLRDRVFALAKKAGVELKQIYVYPLEKWKLANAWASQQNTLLLTDTLLRQLNRREVDAIVAHELAHMKSKHPAKQMWILPVLIGVGMFFFNRSFLRHGTPRFPPVEAVALAIIGGWQLFKFLRGWISRRHEMQADAGGLALSGDGAAFISGLAKIHRMNATPLEFKRLEEGFLTHPSTQRRFEAVARTSNISGDEMKALIAEGLKEAERYPLPAGIVTAPGEEGLIFTSRVKQKSATAFTFLYLFTLGAPPAFFSGVYELLEPTTKGLALVTFALVYAWMIVTMMDRAGQRFVWKLRERLRKKLLGAATADAWFVGLSPHAEARVYEGSYDWDLGYVQLCPRELRYFGEQTKFCVPAADVTAVKLVPGAPRWRPDKVILVEWRDTDAVAGGAFRISCVGRSVSQGSKLATELFERILKWCDATGLPVAGEEALRPVFPEITSTPLQKSRRQQFTSGLILACCIPLAISAALGDEEGRIVRVLIAFGFALGGHIFASIPYWKRPRVFAEKVWQEQR